MKHTGYNRSGGRHSPSSVHKRVLMSTTLNSETLVVTKYQCVDLYHVGFDLRSQTPGTLKETNERYRVFLILVRYLTSGRRDLSLKI